MKGKICGLLGALFVASSIALFTGYSANAVSVYDDIYQTTTDTPYAGAFNWYGQQCDVTDDDSYTFDKFKNKILSANTVPQSAKDDFTEAIANGTYAFGMMSMYANNGNYTLRTPTVSYTTTKGETYFTPDNLLINFSSGKAGMFYFNDFANCVEPSMYHASNSTIVSSKYGYMPYNPSASWQVSNVFVKNITENYPPDYDGPTIKDQEAIVEKEQLWPEYSWNVTSSGELQVKYLGNLKHFLTGTSYLVVEQMSEDWKNVGDLVDSLTVQPAGWLDEKVQLPGASYYMFRIDHNQQLDSPPRPADHNYGIEQEFVQFYWNGRSSLSGDTIGGCEGRICNDQKGTHNNKILKAIEKSKFNDGGLAGLIYAPIEFIARLPSMVNSCQPISLPLLGKDISVSCVRQSVQQSPLGPVYSIISVLVTGLVTWWVAWKTFGTIKNIQDPQDDKVEVLKL